MNVTQTVIMSLPRDFTGSYCDLNFLPKAIHEAEKLFEGKLTEAAAQKRCGSGTVNSERFAHLRQRPTLRLYKPLNFDHKFCFQQVFFGIPQTQVGKDISRPDHNRDFTR